MTVEAMLSFRPALDVHGWLLDLDTRCRFWSAVLDPTCSSSSGEASPPPAPVEVTAGLPGADGDTLIEEHDGSDKNIAVDTPTTPPRLIPLLDGAGDEMTALLPRIIAAAAAAAAAFDTGSSGGHGTEEDARVDNRAGVRRRLERTLQQVAVHRVQQIYARLNGVSALEGAAEAEEEKEGVMPTGLEIEDEADGEERGPRGEDARLEEEARDLVAFACRACGGVGVGGGWGDEDRECGGGSGGGGASWSMMMPYLPVWVGFATKEQVGVSHFAFFFLYVIFGSLASAARRSVRAARPGLLQAFACSAEARFMASSLLPHYPILLLPVSLCVFLCVSLCLSVSFSV